MLRQIYTVNATQVVTSDSRSYGATEANPNGDTDKALAAAKSEYYDRLSKIYVGSDTRVMATVTLAQANGQLILRESIGAFPDMTPQPEPQPEPEEA